MTTAQRIAHKIGNQQRKKHLRELYYKVKPSSKGWIPLGGLIQDGNTLSNRITTVVSI